MENLRGKTAFITGASAGIGKACAELFAENGMNLILTARRIDRIKSLSSSLEKKYGIKALTLKIDVRNFNEVEKGISSLTGEFNQIDFLINNAGLARGFSKIHEGDISHWDEMIDTNVKGLIFVTKQVLPVMMKKKSGHIVNIGSTAGHEVYPMGNVYAATKFAVKSLTKSIRLDVLDTGIKVSSVDPGMVYTEFSLVRFSGDEEKAENVYKGIKPLDARDVAEAVLFCISRPENVNINEIVLTPKYQASSTQVIRREK
jgi:3-hydroxy acid dehydrogenase / malonic semialdehyde reductase